MSSKRAIEGLRMSLLYSELVVMSYKYHMLKIFFGEAKSQGQKVNRRPHFIQQGCPDCNVASDLEPKKSCPSCCDCHGRPQH